MTTEFIIARREARRRRIMENSADRLLYITGKSNSRYSDSQQSNYSKENGFTNEIGSDVERVHCTQVKRAQNPIIQQNNGLEQRFDSKLFPISTSYQNSSVQKEPVLLLLVTLAAILWRFAMEFSCLYIFQSNALLAFILAKCGSIRFEGSMMSETTFIGVLLILSGIPSDKMKFLSVLINSLQLLLRDFAVFVFVLVVSDILIKCVK